MDAPVDPRTELIFIPKISTECLTPEDAARLLILARESYMMIHIA